MTRFLGALALLLGLAVPLMAQDLAKPPPTEAAPPSQCPDNMAAFANSSEVLTCLCPAELTRSGTVWGTDAYTADSATCRAALHAGATTTRGGPVTVRMLPGQPRYLGTTRAGMSSSNYGAYDSSFRFDGAPAAATSPAGAAGPRAMPRQPRVLPGQHRDPDLHLPGDRDP